MRNAARTARYVGLGCLMLVASGVGLWPAEPSLTYLGVMIGLLVLVLGCAAIAMAGDFVVDVWPRGWWPRSTPSDGG